MPGRLRCGVLDLSSPEVFGRVLDALMALVREPGRQFELRLKDRYHFTIPAGPVSSEPGWYVIRGPDALPLYVGTAENLDARLNSDNGSRDGFANPQRTSDPERNFIKAFLSASILSSVSVVVITEAELQSRLGSTKSLSKLDRQKVEKVANIFRARLCSERSRPAVSDGAAQQGAEADGALL